ncbi:MAG: hypothetical protein V4662_02305 [Verrucomicrobiota bacterium]
MLFRRVTGMLCLAVAMLSLAVGLFPGGELMAFNPFTFGFLILGLMLVVFALILLRPM